MITLTSEQLETIMKGASTEKLEAFLDPINSTLAEFQIADTAQRAACFLAQIGHESASLLYEQELASGEAYEGRTDLGNVEPGDGPRFKGRGLIQITGRANYQACGQALGLDLLNDPTVLAEPVPASRSAGWFWSSHDLNALADQGEFETITRRINGGLNGLEDRLDYYGRARQVLGLPPLPSDEA